MKPTEQTDLKLQVEINPFGMWVIKWEKFDNIYHHIQFFLDTKKDKCTFWVDGKETGSVNLKERFN